MVSNNKNNTVSFVNNKNNTSDLLLRITEVHGRALKRFLNSRLLNRCESDDIEQDVYLRLARQNQGALTEKLSISEESTRSYLFSVATNLIRDKYKSPNTTRVESLTDDVVHSQVTDTLENTLSAKQEMNRIKQAILQLEPRCRNAFVLNRYRAMSYKDIAKEMDISVSMVEKHIMLALTNIRQHMKNQ